MLTILLLFASNTFMTVAWYGHLRYRSAPIAVAVTLEPAGGVPAPTGQFYLVGKPG